MSDLIFFSNTMSMSGRRQMPQTLKLKEFERVCNCPAIGCWRGADLTNRVLV